MGSLLQPLQAVPARPRHGGCHSDRDRVPVGITHRLDRPDHHFLRIYSQVAAHSDRDRDLRSVARVTLGMLARCNTSGMHEVLRSDSHSDRHNGVGPATAKGHDRAQHPQLGTSRWYPACPYIAQLRLETALYVTEN